MIITRELVNKNIKYHDYGTAVPKHYDYGKLSSLVDAYKNLFLSKGASRGRSVVIGTKACTEQIALVLACAELGMTITIVNNPFPEVGEGTQVVKKKINQGIISKTYQVLSPVDFFVVSSKTCTDKFEIFRDTCRFTIILNEQELDYTPNNTVLAKSDTVFIKCTSSGTTGIPKVIAHTHDFFGKLIQRNSKMFYGVMGTGVNLNHGSSPGTFFLPGLVAEKVTDFNNFAFLSDSPFLIDLYNYIKKFPEAEINHIMIPYTYIIDDYFDSKATVELPSTMENCVIYTLGIIRHKWVDNMKNKAKDIVSIFGSNETSGPTLLNRATYENFAENTYKVVDDFYSFNLNEKKEFEVTMPVYGTTINTQDTFTIQGNRYLHGGRSNLYRINDLEIDASKYQKIVDMNMKAELLIDTNKDRVYLAVWDDNINEEAIKLLDQQMRKDSNNKHFISSYEKLNYQSFLSGIKLDKELLRDYFRNKL